MSLIRVFIIIFLFYLIYKVLKGWGQSSGKNVPTSDEAFAENQAEPNNAEELIKDPQCGVYFPASEGVSMEVKGEKIYFCSDECKKKYLSDH